MACCFVLTKVSLKYSDFYKIWDLKHWVIWQCMCPDLSEWHNGCVVSHAGAGGYHICLQAGTCALSGESALLLVSQRTVLTYTSMLGHLSSSSGSSAVLKYQWAKQESAAVLLCSYKVPRKGSSSTNISSPKPWVPDLKVRWRTTWWMWVHLAAYQSVFAGFSRHWCFYIRLSRDSSPKY